jgi:hypothetical protein
MVCARASGCAKAYNSHEFDSARSSPLTHRDVWKSGDRALRSSSKPRRRLSQAGRRARITATRRYSSRFRAMVRGAPCVTSARQRPLLLSFAGGRDHCHPKPEAQERRAAPAVVRRV